ncbi:hypothetical protein NJ7G_0122 [Natrinema sp. J7-2]|nr:hypothetical protein NJ7G_0122 [Natrinema sp. J7-2]
MVETNPQIEDNRADQSYSLEPPTPRDNHIPIALTNGQSAWFQFGRRRRRDGTDRESIAGESRSQKYNTKTISRE